MSKNNLLEQKELADKVRAIIEGVSEKGDAALIDFTRQFDGYELPKDAVRIPKSEIKYLLSLMKDEPLKKALSKSAANIKEFHKNELGNIKKQWFTRAKGLKTGQLFNPVETVGVYVPGGRYSYPSTVLMSVIPAKIAGVKKVVITTPPKNITPVLVYAAKIAGVDEIYRVGGAQSIAAFAYGTSSVDQVDMIVGPGNKYVNEAKRQVFGLVGIDSLAGPSEVAIIADESANIEFVKADLLAQVEHDPDALAYFFTTSKKMYEEIKEFAYSNKNEKGKNQIFSTLTVSVKEAVDSVNKVAPEHLELMVKNPSKLIKSIKNAGAVFAGNLTPTALGDYIAGPSHVLPTDGAARFSSGLSVQTFIKRTSYVEVTTKKTYVGSEQAQKIAEIEGLNYHKLSLKVRG